MPCSFLYHQHFGYLNITVISSNFTCNICGLLFSCRAISLLSGFSNTTSDSLQGSRPWFKLFLIYLIQYVFANWCNMVSIMWLFSTPPPNDPTPPLWSTLRWRHNKRDGVSNHQPDDWLLNRLFRSRSKKTPKLRVTGPLCGHKGPVTRKMFHHEWWQNVNMSDRNGETAECGNINNHLVTQRYTVFVPNRGRCIM